MRLGQTTQFLLMLLAWCGWHGVQQACADTLANPPAIPATHPAGQVIDLLIVAAPSTNTLGSTNPTMWVYSVCPRPAKPVNPMVCPPGPETHADYGGVRLNARAGDTLKIRVVNNLPPFGLMPKHDADMPMMALQNNPTNLHTHGLLVSPHPGFLNILPFSDFIFVENYRTANASATGKPTPTSLPGMIVRHDVIEYAIRIPANHPSGLFWFHPHAHGIALNQVSAGMAGLITIGELRDYVCNTAVCNVNSPAFSGVVNYLTLKDTQVLQTPQFNNTVLTQENQRFAAPRHSRSRASAMAITSRVRITRTLPTTGNGFSPSTVRSIPAIQSTRPTVRSGALPTPRAA